MTKWVELLDLVQKCLRCSIDLHGLEMAIRPLKTYVNALSASRAQERKAPFKAWLAKNRIPPSIAAAQVLEGLKLYFA